MNLQLGQLDRGSLVRMKYWLDRIEGVGADYKKIMKDADQIDRSSNICLIVSLSLNGKLRTFKITRPHTQFLSHCNV